MLELGRLFRRYLPILGIVTAFALVVPACQLNDSSMPTFPENEEEEEEEEEHDDA